MDDIKDNTYNRILDSIAKEAENNIKIAEGDYLGEDGLLYCHKCHGKKQCRVNFLGREKVVPCICKCEVERQEREKEEQRRREMQKRIKEYKRMGFADAEMVKYTFAADDLANAKLTRAMQNYVANFDTFRDSGKGLLLYGAPSTGKTFYAACIANELMEKGYPVLMTNFSRVLNVLQSTFDKQAYIDSMNRFPLLILDDLGIERESSYTREQVYNIIDSRYRVGLPLIVTTNLSITEIKDNNDIEKARIYERIIERCIPIEVNTQNRRHQKIKETYAESMRLLGLGGE